MADGITRLQDEIYSYATKYKLPEAATEELLAMLSNLSASDLTCTFTQCDSDTCLYVL